MKTEDQETEERDREEDTPSDQCLSTLSTKEKDTNKLEGMHQNSIKNHLQLFHNYEKRKRFLFRLFF